MLVRWRSRPIRQGPAAHDEIARIGIDRLFLLDPAARVPHEFDVERSGEAAGDLVLRFRKVGPIGIKPVGSKVRAVFGVDQLRVHPNLITSAPHAPFEDIADAELAADLSRVDGFALVGKSGIAGDYEAACDPRKVGGEIVGDAIGEVFLVRVVR